MPGAKPSFPSFSSRCFLKMIQTHPFLVLLVFLLLIFIPWSPGLPLDPFHSQALCDHEHPNRQTQQRSSEPVDIVVHISALHAGVYLDISRHADRILAVKWSLHSSSSAPSSPSSFSSSPSASSGRSSSSAASSSLLYSCSSVICHPFTTSSISSCSS